MKIFTCRIKTRSHFQNWFMQVVSSFLLTGLKYRKDGIEYLYSKAHISEMFHLSVTINNVILEILRILKLNICHLRQPEFSCFWLTDHGKISVHTEQDQSVLCLAQWGRLCAINPERHRLQKADQSGGRDRNKNEDKLGGHWARQRSTTAPS